MEVVNIDPAVKKYFTVTSSAPVLPQLALELSLNPPRPEDSSYNSYTQVRGLSYGNVSI